MQSALKDDKFLICRQISQALTKDALERFLVAYFFLPAYARLEWFLACQKVRRTEPLAGHGKLESRKKIRFVQKK